MLNAQITLSIEAGLTDSRKLEVLICNVLRDAGISVTTIKTVAVPMAGSDFRGDIIRK